MIQKGRAKLVYDSRIEQRHLRGTESFLSSINSIPRDEEHQDVIRLWFMYTRNRAEDQRVEPPLQVTVTSQQVADTSLTGEVNGEWLQETRDWLSFGGHALTQATALEVSHSGAQRNTIRNAHDLTSLMRLLPRYQPSEKHRAEAYVTEDGEFVSAMPLTANDAQDLLLLSLKDATDRWAYHERRGKCFRFKVTHVELEIYHGFEVEDHEVPAPIMNRIRN